jgi:hypothetical protein
MTNGRPSFGAVAAIGLAVMRTVPANPHMT